MTSRTGLLATALGLSLTVILVLSASRSAASGTSLGIDVISSGTADLGTIETCREVSAGQTFDVDVWVQNVTGLQGWEVRLTFDHTKLAPLSHDDALFRPGFPSSGYEGDGSYFLGVASIGSSDGSGVLARVTLQATAPGLVELSLATPFLNPGTNPLPINGGVQGAHIAIGVPCGSVTPPVTQVPTPSPVPTPVPTATPKPTASPLTTPTSVITTPASGTATPAPTGPTQTPAPTPLFDDPDCDGDYDEQDSLRILTDISGVPEPISGCPGVGDSVVGGDLFADIDCDGLVDAEDAVRILQYRAALAPAPAAC